jgi:hypothetical protein
MLFLFMFVRFFFCFPKLNKEKYDANLNITEICKFCVFFCSNTR